VLLLLLLLVGSHLKLAVIAGLAHKLIVFISKLVTVAASAASASSS
jgi:hypothetical protein